MTPQAEPFLLAQFREFYREVVRLKRRVGRDAWVFEGDEPSDEAEEGSDPRSPSAVWQRLLTLLERQASSARRAGGWECLRPPPAEPSLEALSSGVSARLIPAAGVESAAGGCVHTDERGWKR